MDGTEVASPRVMLDREATAPGLLGDLRVVLLDDDREARALLKAGLAALGVAAVREAEDALQALDIIESSGADVLVTERYLPFVRFLRTHRKAAASQIPVVMASAQARQADIREALDAGVDEFVAKPVTPGRLLAHILDAVDRRRPLVVAEGYVGPDRRGRAEDRGGGTLEADRADALLTPAEIAALLKP